MSKRSVWVTYGRTESGDDLQPLVWWGAKPTEAEVDAIYKKMMPDEYKECGGVRHKTVKASVQ